MRADARRNRERIVAAAGEVVAEQGADASLEEVARRAGVGSATLHRHFPSRRLLLEAVFRGRVEELCARAEELLGGPDPAAALVVWLGAVAAHAVANRGLGAALMQDAADASDAARGPGADAEAEVEADGGAGADADGDADAASDADGGQWLGAACHAMITEAGGLLLERARAAGAVRPEVAVGRLLRLVGAIASATEGEPDGAVEAERLLDLAVHGIWVR